MTSKEKVTVITCGDPGGVGVEVALKAFISEADAGRGRFVFVGDGVVLRDGIDLLEADIELRETASVRDAKFDGRTINFISPEIIKTFRKGQPSPEGGKASAEYIRMAVELIMKGEAHALVTAPISKEAIKMAGVPYPGHTEMLADLTGASDYAMMLCGGPLRVILVTIHVAIKDVSSFITKERVLKTIRLASKASEMLGIDNPVIAVAGLNPHAGEGGIFGDEEKREIIPAIEEAEREGISLKGPYPPDTLFYSAYKGEADVVVVMYHDQGLIPLKMIAFDKGVNVTVGLPIIRTSPDHGTAYDIAWKGIANPESMVEAVRLAERIKNRDG